MHYLFQFGDWILVKGYEFLSFAKNIKSLSCKYRQKLLDCTKQSATDAPKII